MATAPTTPLLDRAAALDLSVTALAARFYVMPAYMGEWLIGSRPVPDHVVGPLAEILGVDPDTIRDAHAG